MKAMGVVEYHFCFLLGGCPNGSRPPATTRLFASTACTESATALTMSRYTAGSTGLRLTLTFGSFQTWNTCTTGTPATLPS